MGFWDWLPIRRKEKAEFDAAALRAEFAERYHHFKLFLNANSETHELMTDIEEGLRGVRPFGMQFVRAVCTRLSTAVFQCVKQLDELAPDKYGMLYERFAEIQRGINPIIARHAASSGGPLVMRLRDVLREHVDLVGPKMASMGEVKNRLGIPIPRGFVITAESYRHFMAHNELQSEIDRRIQAAEVGSTEDIFNLSSSIQQLIMEAPLPDDVERAILEGFEGLKDITGIADLRVAMRSSALAEDLLEASFAGQYRTKLNVSSEELLASYRMIVASKYSLQAVAYRLNRGIRDEDVAMCVGCMAMVDAVCGGVAYTRNPLNVHDDTVHVHSAWGLAKGVVDGAAGVDVVRVSRLEPFAMLSCEVSRKKAKFVCLPGEGTCRMEVDEADSGRCSLAEADASQVARLAIRIEDYYGAPQDVEWAVTPAGQVVVLQCRPLALVPGAAGADRVDESDRALGVVLAKGGTTAAAGVAAGPVYVVRKDADLLGFPHGAVLVVRQALPKYAALLNRAAAVVTEQGSLAGHLATVAREFEKPAVMGLPDVTERLTPGMTVTVDADGRTIYEGEVPLLLQRHVEPRNPMMGSPVYKILQAVSEHVLPLTLLDPDSPDFRARNCRTFHDIMRYSHEKAVREMFRFGTEHDFPQAAAKQLMSDVRKQFWVVNLDDGIDGDVSGSTVDLSRIVSVPMLALWRGMNAFPWAGPPPMHTKGMLSVMFEATANPYLNVTTQAAGFAVKNYFLISRNYCSLQSRFGFHFCAVEALVGERPEENYISFSFKGGAASLDRRILRTRFVGEMLEEFGFDNRIREDHLTARLENYDRVIMEHRLRVLGYLIIHTRQLDMVMTDQEGMAKRRALMLEHIETLAEP